MAGKLPVWGIDIGQVALKGLKLQGDEDHMEIVAFDFVPHQTILSQASADAPAMIKQSIETFLSRNDVRGSEVVVSVPGQQTLTRFTKMPPVEPKKIPDMVRYEAGQQIPFDMDEVVWDYQIFTEEDSPDVEVGIFAIRRELIRNHLSHFTDAGVEPIIAQAGPMASYNAVRFDRPPPEGEAMILLDMGALATDLIVMEGNSIWSRPVPIGGNRFTEALVSAFKVSFKKAEDLKRNAASTKYARQIFQAMRPVFADMVSEVQRSIGFYTSTHRDANITRVLGMGNAFKLPGLQKFLHQNLQIEVEKLTRFEKLSTSSYEKRPEFADNIMSLSVAYGLAIQGLGLAAVESNLLPMEITRKLLWKKKRVWFAASAACLGLAAGSVWLKNSLVHAALNEGMGSVTSPTLTPVGGVEPAEQLLNAPAQGSPLEYARDVGRAATTLKNEFTKLGTGGGTQDLEDMAALPRNNIIAPRVVDVIQRSVVEVASDSLKAVKSAEDYKTLADRVPRKQRDELWITDLWMGFTPADPGATFSQGDGTRKPVRKPGWAIRITGRTTRPNPAQWLDDTFVKALDELGKQPDRGFYLHEIEVVSVKNVPQGGASRGGLGGRGSRAGGLGNTVRPGRGRLGGGRPGGAGGGFSPSGGSSRNQQNVRPLVQAMVTPGKDPVTGEDSTTDREFVIQLVAYKWKLPKKLIPERWKPAPAEGDADGDKAGGS